MTGQTPEQQGAVFVPAFGKVEELNQLDAFVWATLRGWGMLPIGANIHRSLPALQPGGGVEEAGKLAMQLKEEENSLLLFTKEQARDDYPYLFSLASVRLWSIVESGVREFLVETVKASTDPAVKRALAKIEAPIGAFVGADLESQADMAADLLLRSAKGKSRGVARFEDLSARLGYNSSPPGIMSEILTELAETRNCVVHRGGRVDSRFLEACPWLEVPMSSPVPANLARYWFHRNGVYWYVMDLVRRWADTAGQTWLTAVTNEMHRVVMDEMEPAWLQSKRSPNHRGWQR